VPEREQQSTGANSYDPTLLPEWQVFLRAEPENYYEAYGNWLRARVRLEGGSHDPACLPEYEALQAAEPDDYYESLKAFLRAEARAAGLGSYDPTLLPEWQALQDAEPDDYYEAYGNFLRAEVQARSGRRLHTQEVEAMWSEFLTESELIEKEWKGHLAHPIPWAETMALFYQMAREDPELLTTAKRVNHRARCSGGWAFGQTAQHIYIQVEQRFPRVHGARLAELRRQMGQDKPTADPNTSAPPGPSNQSPAQATTTLPKDERPVVPVKRLMEELVSQVVSAQRERKPWLPWVYMGAICLVLYGVFFVWSEVQINKYVNERERSYPTIVGSFRTQDYAYIDSFRVTNERTRGKRGIVWWVKVPRTGRQYACDWQGGHSGFVRGDNVALLYHEGEEAASGVIVGLNGRHKDKFAEVWVVDVMDHYLATDGQVPDGAPSLP
jgi:hypothetical protein